MPASPIYSPSAYSVSRAVAYADTDGSALLVSASNPLPVSVGATASVTPLAGNTSVSAVFGPYVPVIGRTTILTLDGVWAGSVKLLRSTDGGATKLPLTIAGAAWGQFSTNCCEPVWDESDMAARLYLDVALTSGSVTYRLAQ